MRTPALPSTSFAVLGVLSIRDMSAYELAAFADMSLGYFWPMHRSLVYKELPRLEAAGYVIGTSVVQQRSPDKRVYRLAQTGQDRLDQWLASPGFQTARLRNEFLLRLFFAGRLGRRRQQALLAEYRVSVEQDLVDLRATVAKCKDIPGAFFGGLTALHGVRSREAMLLWIADAEQALAALPTDDSAMT